MQTRARLVLDKTINLLDEINQQGIFTALSKGIFADVKRPIDGGKGLDGVASKGDHYYNPTIELMKNFRIEGKL